MNKYLKGQSVPFGTIEDRRKLVGKYVVYLRKCDIDRSGRGYFFPRYDVVEYVKGRQIYFEDGNSVYASDLVEMCIRGEAAE